MTGVDAEAWRMIGTPEAGGILIVSDHASARVPDDIDLQIDASLLREHVAIDIGVAQIAELLVQRPGFYGFLGNVSRLVCDLNRDATAPCVVPAISDGHVIAGNVLDDAGRAARIARFLDPYHAALESLIETNQPGLILSLHSFTPRLAADPGEARPWHIGVLYNQDRRGAAAALAVLNEEPDLCVGDQQPYSGEELNASMDIHAEAHGRLYFGVEVRQDLISDAAGQARWADILERVGRAVLAGAR